MRIPTDPETGLKTDGICTILQIRSIKSFVFVFISFTNAYIFFCLLRTFGCMCVCEVSLGAPLELARLRFGAAIVMAPPPHSAVPRYLCVYVTPSDRWLLVHIFHLWFWFTTQCVCVCVCLVIVHLINFCININRNLL